MCAQSRLLPVLCWANKKTAFCAAFLFAPPAGLEPAPNTLTGYGTTVMLQGFDAEGVGLEPTHLLQYLFSRQGRCQLRFILPFCTLNGN